MSLKSLPTLNAILNSTAAILLIAGWYFIKHGQQKRHIQCMIGALIMSAFFLCSYLTYHAFEGTTRYQGEGIWRTMYFTILLTHTPLAALIVPASLLAVFFAWNKDYTKHTRITRWLLPVWIYVSVTGVAIYLMLYRL